MKTQLAVQVAILLCVSIVHAGPQEDLIIACKQGDVNAAGAALAAGAKPNMLDVDGETALSWAFFWPEVTALLLEKGADPNLGKHKPVFQAAVFYSKDVLRLLLDAGANPNLPTVVEPSALFRPLIAAERKKGGAANQALINAWENASRTLPPSQAFALQTAVKGTSCAPCLELLLEKGAKVGPTPEGNLLHTLADSLSISAEQWKKGFSQARDNIGAFGLKLPDWYAATMPADRFGSPEPVVRLLVARGVNINEKSKVTTGMGPMTPLEIVLNTGLGSKREIMLALLNNGADPKLVHPTYGPLILQAAAIGFPEVLKAMIEKGADLHTTGLVFVDGSKTLRARTFNPLTAAALKNRTDAVSFLLGAGGRSRGGVRGQVTVIARGEYGPEGCLADASNKTAVFFAIENDNLEMTKAIVESGDYDGKPFSMRASKFGGCLGGGSYNPSAWAQKTRASEAVLAYLASKGL